METRTRTPRPTGRRWRIGAMLAVVVAVAMQDAGALGRHNGFDLESDSVPARQIHRGGPPRDGIPALTAPATQTAGAAGWLDDDDRVLGLRIGPEARAYPVRILDWHEVVNDHLGGRAVVVTWCPLCGSGVAFAADAGGAALEFGVSGLLYNSDVLLYDRRTESLWSQIPGRAIAGPLRDTVLQPLPVVDTTWGAWKREHPDTTVVSPATGHARDYSHSPYAGYASDPDTLFPVAFRSARLHPKERVLGLRIGGTAKAYPFAALARGARPLADVVDGVAITIDYDSAAESARALAADGSILPTVTLYWFAWYAFHPDTRVHAVP